MKLSDAGSLAACTLAAPSCTAYRQASETGGLQGGLQWKPDGHGDQALLHSSSVAMHGAKLYRPASATQDEDESCALQVSSQKCTAWLCIRACHMSDVLRCIALW